MNTPDEQKAPGAAAVKRGRGRPPGSKNKPKQPTTSEQTASPKVKILKEDYTPKVQSPAKKRQEEPRKNGSNTNKRPQKRALTHNPNKEREQEPAARPAQQDHQHQHQQGQDQGQGRHQGRNKSRENNRNNWDRRDKRDKNKSGEQSRFNQRNKRHTRDDRDKQHQARPQKENREPREQKIQRDYVPVGDPEEMRGLLDITTKNFGFLLPLNGESLDDKIYIPADLIAQHHLRPFQEITGMTQRFERGHQMINITAVNGLPPEEAAIKPHFDELKAVNPTHRIAFETEPQRYTTRTLDLIAPIARGQRGLIVAPPRTGKTTLLMHMAEAIQENYSEDMHLMILLVDERPEEVTEFRRSLPQAEVYASSNDSKVQEHCRTAEICVERAKRLVESGQHVLLLLDSITRLARAYNNNQRGNGRTMSGGIDARALEIPRRLFAAARNTRTAGSLSIIATALIETNSRMDDLIFQEFKGTGNMELVLNRRIAEMYIYPAVDILKSGTRREELILPAMQLEKIRLIRRALAGHKPAEAMERLLFFLRKYKNNAQMLIDLKSR